MTLFLQRFGARALLPFLVFAWVACGDDDGPADSSVTTDAPATDAPIDDAAETDSSVDDAGDQPDARETVDAAVDARVTADAGDDAATDVGPDAPFVQMCTGTPSCAAVMQEQCTMTTGCSESRLTGQCVRRVGLKIMAPLLCTPIGDPIDCEGFPECRWRGDCVVGDGVTCESLVPDTCGALGCALTCATGEDCDDAQSCVDGRCVTL